MRQVYHLLGRVFKKYKRRTQAVPKSAKWHFGARHKGAKKE